jgi:hypothetical protein
MFFVDLQRLENGSAKKGKAGAELPHSKRNYLRDQL